MSTNLKTLIGKLNDTTRRAFERAANLTMARGNYEVDIEHLFLALLEEPKSDVVVLCRKFDISSGALTSDLERTVFQLKQGNTRTPVFSPNLAALLEHGWLIASLDAGYNKIRSAHLLLAMLTEPGLRQLAHRASKLFAQFGIEDLKHNLAKVTKGSDEASEAGPAAEGANNEGDEESTAAVTGPNKTRALDQFTTHLTGRARAGHLDPVIGRESEIRQVVDILMRRRQNNPILTGEAGVGKTAVVEGLALRIAANDVPPPLQGVELHVLDMGLLQAGASVKGEFENRLKNVIDEVKKSPHPIILFIDEAHTMIGAGGQAGQNDAANLLKPALARGELRTIAATTWAEYKKYFEKDAALARRFQVVKVEEPSEPIAASMLRAMVPLMEAHFKVRVFDEAITEAVRLSARYITGRQLPDKAVGVLDTACAKVALGQNAVPAAMENKSKLLERMAVEIAALEREMAAGSSHGTKLAELTAQRETVTAELATLSERHAAEKKLIDEIQAMRKDLEASNAGADPKAAPAAGDGKTPDGKAAERPAKKGIKKSAALAPVMSPQMTALLAKQEELVKLQGESPLIPMHVDGVVVAEIVAAWTGIPLGKMVKDELKTVRGLQPLLAERVIGQDHSLAAVAQRVRIARASLEDPNKPKAVFLFVGPSGVGKTETALALADVLYGGERKMVTINMSEYQEAHSVSGLKGSPPGYVGYGEGGVLTEAVRRNPYSVVLLDEVEKAHPDVLELFFQVFDKGMLADAEGRDIDFRNTIFILTSNIGSQQIMQACLNKTPEELPDAETLAAMLKPVLYKTFKPALVGRMTVVPYYPITDAVLENIIRLKLDRIAKRVSTNHKAQFIYDSKLVEAVLARCTEVDTGARNIDNILNGSLLPQIADNVLSHMAEGTVFQSIKATAAKNGDFRYTVQ